MVSLIQFCKAYVVGEQDGLSAPAPGKSLIEFTTSTTVLSLAARAEAEPGNMLRLFTQKTQGMIGEHWAWSEPELQFECDLSLLDGRGTQYETKLEPFISVHNTAKSYLWPNRLMIETDVHALVWLFGHREREERTKQIGNHALIQRELTTSLRQAGELGRAIGPSAEQLSDDHTEER